VIVLGSFALDSPSGPAWEFLLLFLVVICGPPLVKRGRIPGIIGLLLGGFVIGPHALNLITAGNTTVPELGQVGLLYLMFVAGVELDLALLRVHRRAAIGFGLLTFGFPMLFGTIVGFALSFGVPASLLLGSLLASHTLLLYPMIREKGLASDPAAASAVGATVLTDTLALIVLAAVAGSNVEGGTPATIALQVGVGLVVLLGFSLVVLPHIVRFAFRHLAGDRSVRYLVVFAGFLAAASLAGVLKIEGIVGAFFAGMALNRFVPNEGPLMRRIEFFGSTVFIPIFLVSVGLLLNPQVIVQSATLKYAGLFVVACLGGKLAAAWAARRLWGYSRAQAGVIFGLTAPQAAATLASTVVGYDIGLFDQSVVNAVLVLILVSVVAATVTAERSASGVPRPASEHGRMGARVLVAVEQADRAALAISAAARIAATDGGVVQALLVATRSAAQGRDADLQKLAGYGFELGIDVDPRLVVDRSLADAVVHAAAADHASLVLVVESLSAGTPAFGSWPEAVAGAAPAPVVIVHGASNTFADVQLQSPEDGATQGGLAALLAAELAVRLGGPGVQAHEPGVPAGPGALRIVPIGSWESVERMRAAPADPALLLVPEPAVPLQPPAALPETGSLADPVA
jgi:Kef-type K+ transport system membrane component KefB